jgi:hypothetical protein
VPSKQVLVRSSRWMLEVTDTKPFHQSYHSSTGYQYSDAVHDKGHRCINLIRCISVCVIFNLWVLKKTYRLHHNPKYSSNLHFPFIRKIQAAF